MDLMLEKIEGLDFRWQLVDAFQTGIAIALMRSGRWFALRHINRESIAWGLEVLPIDAQTANIMLRLPGNWESVVVVG